ncbi:hypothetical protein CS297_14145 [Pseudomonas syringae pv. actinidiae]|nr:hypothetical protein CS297_14145 [Pseudomonas syringae pv. actinidiae]
MYEYLGFCPEGVGASGGYDGCDGLRSGPEISDLDSPGVLWTLVLLPVPGSSRASSLLRKSRDRGQAKRRPVSSHGLWPESEADGCMTLSAVASMLSSKRFPSAYGRSHHERPTALEYARAACARCLPSA